MVLETGVVIFGKEDWLVTGKKHTETSGGLIICFLIWDGGYVSGSHSVKFYQNVHLWFSSFLLFFNKYFFKNR